MYLDLLYAVNYYTFVDRREASFSPQQWPRPLTASGRISTDAAQNKQEGACKQQLHGHTRRRAGRVSLQGHLFVTLHDPQTRIHVDRLISHLCIKM